MHDIFDTLVLIFKFDERTARRLDAPLFVDHCRRLIGDSVPKPIGIELLLLAHRLKPAKWSPAQIKIICKKLGNLPRF